MSDIVRIGGRQIGFGAPCFVIAEAGVNHNGDLDLAHRLVDVAAEAGADAVKFQTFAADRLAAVGAPKAAYQMRTTSPNESQHAMLKRLELTVEAHQSLIEHCRQQATTFLSSPFDEQAADLLDRLNVAAFKVPSGEIVNLPFLRHLAAKGRPIILSTGMADLAEVEAAVDTIHAVGHRALVLLHCLSDYPADPRHANLRAMATLRSAFGLAVGFSDHTVGTAVPLAAVALGACVIERHFTLDRTLPGPDHPASLEPTELRDLIGAIRSVEAALGDGRKRPQPSELENRTTIRKSIAAARDLPAGVPLQARDLTAIRPGTGLSPAIAGELLGRWPRVDVPAGALLTWHMLI
jgi:N-acetylneuraminate synthase/N,N'-diacetyllegionaminate synthase